jgi:proprotein convertase subtilisin/kexin type 5
VRACPYGSTLVPATNDCQCNQRYYFQNGVCLSCPQTCLTCTSSTVCVTCVPGYNLVGTQCVATNPVNPACLPAQFRAIPNWPCLNCPGFCITCNAANTCSQCATGFSWNATVATCTEICGDGIRFAQQCDDGNTISGDGCSSTCTIEPGWICMKNPANPTGPDYCVRPNNPTTTLYIRQFGPVQTSVSKATFQI